MSVSLSKFERWFVEPIRRLEQLEKGDGAFAALSLSFGLFERYIKSDLKRRDIVANPENFFSHSAEKTGVELELFKKFWGMFRDGVQHFLQPKTFSSNGIFYGWTFGHTFPAMPYYLVDTPEERTIAFDPWKWTEFVLSLYHNDPEILDVMESHAFGGIYDFGAGKGSPVVEFATLPLFLCPGEEPANKST